MPTDFDFVLWVPFLLSVLFALPAAAQIGGKTASDGVFVLDDAESLDLAASGVQGNCISDMDDFQLEPLAGAHAWELYP